MVNPYQAPTTNSQNARGAGAPRRNLSRFLAWGCGAFLVVQIGWHLSRTVRHLDMLELPMIAAYFPLAMFFDPGDAMLHNRNLFFYAAGFWTVVMVLAWCIGRPRHNPAWLGLAVVAATSVASLVYALLMNAGTRVITD